MKHGAKFDRENAKDRKRRRAAEEKQNIEILVNDSLHRMREDGIEAKATFYCISNSKIISFEIKIIGYLD